MEQILFGPNPILLGREQWDLVARVLPNFVLFVGMMVNGAISFLLGHSVIPSLEVSSGLVGRFRPHRTVLYLTSAASILLMLFALYRAIVLTTFLLREIYPRFAI